MKLFWIGDEPLIQCLVFSNEKNIRLENVSMWHKQTVWPLEEESNKDLPLKPPEGYIPAKTWLWVLCSKAARESISILSRHLTYAPWLWEPQEMKAGLIKGVFVKNLCQLRSHNWNQVPWIPKWSRRFWGLLKVQSLDLPFQGYSPLLICALYTLRPREGTDRIQCRLSAWPGEATYTQWVNKVLWMWASRRWEEKWVRAKPGPTSLLTVFLELPEKSGATGWFKGTLE